MEPEDLPWPGELEEEEEEGEAEEAEERANLDSDEEVMVEEVEEEERRELDSDFNYESQPGESTDDEDDEEAKAWLQAHPDGPLPPSSLPRHRYSEDELTGPEKVVPLTCHVWQQPLYQGNSGTEISDTIVVSVEKTAWWGSKADQRTESWHYLPQEMDSSHTLDITQTKFNMREEGTKVTDFTSVEEGILTQPETEVKEPKRGLLCSPLLVIQDNFASPDLPLLTCLTQDQEFGSDSLFQQSELDFAPLRGIPGKSEDTAWFSRPSEVSEALFQAASEVASDLVNSCVSLSQHSLIASTAVECQHSFLPFGQGTKEETISSDTVDELKTPKDFDSYDALCSYMAWKKQEVQEPETSLADKGQVSVSSSSYTSDEYMTPEGSDSFDASCSYVQYWKQKALQQSEKYLTSKDHDSYSDSSDTTDKNKIPNGSDNFRAPFSCMLWSKQEASHDPETYAINKDCVSFPHEVAPHFNNKMSRSFLHCLLERRGKGIPLTAHSHYFESVYLRAPAENEVKEMMDSLEGYERNEEDLGKELSQGFELKENRNTLVFSEMHPRSSEIQYIENVIVPDNSVEVSEIHIHSRQHGISKMEVSGGPLQTIKSSVDETSEQLYLQEERNQRATSTFSGESVDSSENVAFEVVIASIEPSKKESTVNEIQTDISKSLINDSQESEPKNSPLSLLNYNDENSFFDGLRHPHYQSTPGVFELVASKPLFHKKDNGDSSLYWHLDLKSLPNAPQEMFIKPLSVIPELKSSASLSEKSHSQTVGLGNAQSALFQCDLDSEPFLSIGKIKSVPDLDLAEKVGSSDIFYPMKVSTSDSLVLQDLRTFEEVADSSNCILVKNVNSSDIIEGPSATVGSSFSANLVTCDAKSQGALPMTSNASLIAVSQESLLKADVGHGKIPEPMGAKSGFTIHKIMQNDSYFVEGPQGKAESDTSTLDDDTECCNLDENPIVCSTRVADLQREAYEQGDLTVESIELAGFKNVLDDLEVCDSSLHWQSALQLPSKEESDFEEPVGSNMDINQTFSSILPPFIPHEPTVELEYHSSDLRMLRVSPDAVQKTLRQIAGDTSKGGIAEVTQSSLKPGSTATSGVSDTGSHLFLFPKEFPQLALRSPQENTIGHHTDTLNQQASVDSNISEETLKVSTVSEVADQKTGISTVPSSSYSQKGKPGIFYPQALSDSHLTEEALKVAAVPGPAVLKSGIPTVFPSSYSCGGKHNIFYQQALPGSHLTEETLKFSAVPGPADQKTGIPTVLPSSYSRGEKHIIFHPQALPESHLTEEALKLSAIPGPAGQKTSIPTVLPSSCSRGEKHNIFYQQALPDSHLTEEALKVSAIPGPAGQKTSIPTVLPSSYSLGEKHSIFHPQTLPDSHLTEETLKISAAPVSTDERTEKTIVPSTSYSQREKHIIFSQQQLSDGHLTKQVLKVSFVPGPTDQNTGIPSLSSRSYSLGEKPSIFYQQVLPDSHLIEQTQKVAALPGPANQKTRVPAVSSTSYSHRERPRIFYQQTLPESHLTEQALKFSAPGSTEQKTGIPTTSLTDSREEEGVLESDDGAGSSVDSLAAHVRNLLKCESSLNHAKQILRNAEEEECRVRARAWNLKFNLAHECGYSISELNEDDRRKVEEIKAKLFGHERTTDLSKGLRSPRGIGCKPEAVCSHIIIESHEKGCFRTLTAEQPQLDSHPCVFRSADRSEMISGQRSPSSWRTRHIDLSQSLDQSNPHFKVWNSLQLRSHSPFQNFTADDFRISQGLRMPFHEKIDPWLSELVEPACVPPEEMDCHSSSQMLPPEPMKKFTTSITFSSHRHSKCFSDSSVLKVGVTEGSQCTGASVGVFNSHFTEEQNPPRELEQRISSPSSFKIVSHSPDKAVTILAESSRQSQKLSVEHSQQEEKLLERSDFKGSDSEPSTSAKCSNVKEVHFSDNHTFISMSRPSSTLGVKEKNVTITPDLASHIILERELFEPSKAPHADHHVRKHHSPPPQHQDYIAPNLPCRIFLEKRELFEQSKAPHLDHQMRESHSPFPQGQEYIASDLPSSIFLEQRQLFEQSKAPDVDHLGKYHSPLPQGQDYVVERNNQHKFKSYISNMINVEAKFNNVVSQSAPSQCTLVTSASTPPSNRKALSCVRITLYPKTPSKLDSGTLDKRFHSLDPASKTRMNSEFNSDLQTISSRSLEPTSKLLTGKPVAQNQESLGFLGPKSSPDFQVVQSPLPDSNTISQDLKNILFQNSQIVTSRQTQVNISDLEGYSSPEGTPVSADRPSEEIKTPFSAFPGKLSSDAVTQITTESPGKTMFSSEIFINADDRGLEIPEPSTEKLGKVPVRFASSSSVQQIPRPHGTDAQPSLLPYKPPGSTKMYYVPQLKQIPSSLDSRSDTTIESSHSGSNDAIAPDFPAEVLGTRDDDLPVTDNIKHKEGIYSKRAVVKAPLPVGGKPPQKDNADAQVQVSLIGDEDISDKNQKKEIYDKKAVTKAAQPEEKESLQKTTEGSGGGAAAEDSARPHDIKIESLPDTKAIKQKEEIHSKRTVPKEAWTKEKESLQIDIAESRCHSEFENTTHSVFRSAKFYFHHPVHLPSDQDFCHESLGRSVFMRHSWKDFFQHRPDKQREHIRLPSPHQNVDKTKADYTRIESLSINVNLENEVMHSPKSRARDYPKSDKQINDQKKDHKVTPEPTAQHSVSLNELWNKYQERKRQQKPPEFSDRKELSLVERLDRLAKLLQNPITYSLRTSESTQDDSRGERDVKEWSGRQQQQKNKLQKKKRYRSLEKFHKTAGELKKSKVLSTHQAGKPNQIKIEQIKFDKYILRKQPGVHYRNDTSSDSRPSEESELLTDTPTNIVSTTTSPVESDILTQTDREVTLHERSSSISTIDTARLIQAFGQERVCLSPRRIKLYSSLTDHQRRYFERRNKKNKKALNMSHPQMTSEHTRRKHIQVANYVISSDSVSSSTSSFWSSSSTLGNKQNVQMLNKSIQAGNLEIVNGVKKHTRDVGMTFPTPSSSEARIEEDSDVTSWSEEKIEEKRLLDNYLGDKKLRKNKQSCCEGVSWFIPVENVKSGPKENLPKHYGPGICWFAPITNTKPWREPLREQNWQGQHMDSHRPLAGPGRDPLKPFVRATLQESLQFHRPDFISRSGERIKRLKLIVQERKLQNMLQSEREALFNTAREWQGYRDPVCPLLKRGFLGARKNRPIGKKEMIQRSKRIYEQLPEVQRKREEEKRRLEYKSYRLRAQLFKKKVTNQLLGRKVPWN
ncbi:Alstrom syndrome protein 1 isoform X18 [Ailuropoda melanoleuca]|uniref:Alstrom syndrome protein 1 isoform X18 n=1 Tax=Ailuropoda melanoleuca TaxID=9646 RepID=UPI001493F132|nr:Alstrom syndrome protein 1 isoform X18 [Ailuropoda melanoleuca]